MTRNRTAKQIAAILESLLDSVDAIIDPVDYRGWTLGEVAADLRADWFPDADSGYYVNDDVLMEFCADIPAGRD